MNYRSSIVFLLLPLIIIALCLPTTAIASTVRAVNLEEVSLNTDLIFEGRVISKETRPSPQDNSPYTYFTFVIIEVIKGSYPDRLIEIGFEGGTINGLTLSITGLRMPEMNESGVYFVESLTQELVHPLYGWSQGHYIIDTVNNVRKVRQVPFGPVASPQARAAIADAAPTLSDFKQQIRNILGTTAP